MLSLIVAYIDWTSVDDTFSQSIVYVGLNLSGVADMTMLSNSVGDYPFISQGKTRIPGINDSEEFELTVVSYEVSREECVLIPYPRAL